MQEFSTQPLQSRWAPGAASQRTDNQKPPRNNHKPIHKADEKNSSGDEPKFPEFRSQPLQSRWAPKPGARHDTKSENKTTARNEHKPLHRTGPREPRLQQPRLQDQRGDARHSTNCKDRPDFKGFRGNENHERDREGHSRRDQRAQHEPHFAELSNQPLQSRWAPSPSASNSTALRRTNRPHSLPQGPRSDQPREERDATSPKSRRAGRRRRSKDSNNEAPKDLKAGADVDSQPKGTGSESYRSARDVPLEEWESLFASQVDWADSEGDFVQW